MVVINNFLLDNSWILSWFFKNILALWKILLPSVILLWYLSCYNFVSIATQTEQTYLYTKYPIVKINCATKAIKNTVADKQLFEDEGGHCTLACEQYKLWLWWSLKKNPAGTNMTLEHKCPRDKHVPGTSMSLAQTYHQNKHGTGTNMTMEQTWHWNKHVTGTQMSSEETCHWNKQHVTGTTMSLEQTTSHRNNHVTGTNMSSEQSCHWNKQPLHLMIFGDGVGASMSLHGVGALMGLHGMLRPFLIANNQPNTSCFLLFLFFLPFWIQL